MKITGLPLSLFTVYFFLTNSIFLFSHSIFVFISLSLSLPLSLFLPLLVAEALAAVTQRGAARPALGKEGQEKEGQEKLCASS